MINNKYIRSGLIQHKQFSWGWISIPALFSLNQKLKYMKLKLFLFALVAFFATTANAQSIFKPLPRYSAPKDKIVIVDTLPPVTTDSVFTGFRFTGPMVLYAMPNSSVFTGVGVDYEHDIVSATTGKWYTSWAIAGGVYAGGQFAPTGVSGVTAIGLSASFFNKILTVGVLYNLTTKSVQYGLGPSVSLNN